MHEDINEWGIIIDTTLWGCAEQVNKHDFARVQALSVRVDLLLRNPFCLSRAPLTMMIDKQTVVVFALITSVGITSWIVVNSVWSELSFFANSTPEGWAIASWITICVEVSNVCPLLFFIVTKLFTSATRKRVLDQFIIGFGFKEVFADFPRANTGVVINYMYFAWHYMELSSY